MIACCTNSVALRGMHCQVASPPPLLCTGAEMQRGEERDGSIELAPLGSQSRDANNEFITLAYGSLDQGGKQWYITPATSGTQSTRPLLPLEPPSTQGQKK